MPEILIFGAGNIGRAFIGQVFSANGWTVVFADINKEIINLLNERKSYPVVIRQEGVDETVVTVDRVSAISVNDKTAVCKKLVEADIIATSVGKNALPHIAPVLAEGLLLRFAAGAPPVDLILAENIHDGRALLEGELEKYLPLDFKLKERLGIIQTSIGKMVPVVPGAELSLDQLIVASEQYNELILDKAGFLNKIPDFPEINAVDNIAAYVDRKLFIHNLGHAAAAYLGNLAYPEEPFIEGVLADKKTNGLVRAAMEESASALILMYPHVFTKQDLQIHIEDLLCRFKNKALGDTVFRVGRDLRRKLFRDDRVIGAMVNCENTGTSWDNIRLVFEAALKFSACDEAGNPFKDDLVFIKCCQVDKNFLENQCGLDYDNIAESRIISKLNNHLYKILQFPVT